MDRKTFRKPPLAQILALVYMLTPVAGHYLFGPVTTFGYVILGFVFAAGPCVLMRRKWSWSLAIVSLCIAALLNLFAEVTWENSNPLSMEYIFFCVFGMLVMIAHMRYPWFDRREHIWGVNYRYVCNLPCQIGEMGASIDSATGAQVTNISRTGAFVRLPASMVAWIPGTPVNCWLGGQFLLRGTVVRSSEAPGLAIQFHALDDRSKGMLKKLLRFYVTEENRLGKRLRQAPALPERLQALFNFGPTTPVG